MTALADALALMSAGWSEADAIEAVTVPLEAEIERLRRVVVRERAPRDLTRPQARALRALNAADVFTAAGEDVAAIEALGRRGDIRTQRILKIRGLVTGLSWPAPQLTPAGWAWIEANP